MTKCRAFSIRLMLGLCPTLWVGTGHAQPTAVDRGHQLAGQMCSQCHRITRGSGSWTDAPPFGELAAKTRLTQQQLANFIMQPHFDMIIRELTQTQASEIATYILSLKPRH